MNEMMLWILILVDVGLFATSAILFSTLRAERKSRQEQFERTNHIAFMLEEMVRLNECAFRNMTHTIHSIETEVKKTERDSEVPSGEKRQRVLSLLRKGMDVDEVTRRLNIPRGEVELAAQIASWTPGAAAPLTRN